MHMFLFPKIKDILDQISMPITKTKPHHCNALSKTPITRDTVYDISKIGPDEVINQDHATLAAVY